jgi:D-serine deaminase-like pyridoxal phosphate-dependent protein
MLPRVTSIADLPTPALVVDTTAFAHNLDTMSAALPGARLRPHVKAHKCTSLAREQARRGHLHFTAATPREILGMAQAGLGDDLLLANECVDPARLRALADCGAPVTVAIDSEETLDAAAANGIGAVLVDVNV